MSSPRFTPEEEAALGNSQLRKVLDQVLDALEPFDTDQRIRIVKAAAILLDIEIEFD